MSEKQDERSTEERRNKIKSLLDRLTPESAMSITEIWELLRDADYEVTHKTIERDISKLTDLATTGSNPARYYYPPGASPNYKLEFNDQQLQTIFLALQNFKSLSPEFIKKFCDDAEKTLINKLPTKLGNEFRMLKTISSVGHNVLGESAEFDKETYLEVIKALRTGYMFECRYHSPYQPEKNNLTRVFAPLILHYVGGTPYIFAYDNENEKKPIKNLRINRIHKIRILTDKVDPQHRKNINLEHVFGGFGGGKETVLEYTVHCTKQMANIFEEQRIHPSQKITKISDTQFAIKFNLANSDEVTRILSQYGEWIEKIEPDFIYEKVKQIWKKGLKAA